MSNKDIQVLMRLAALTSLAALLAILVAAQPAAAECSTVGDEVFVQVCDDGNGNLAPDKIQASSGDIDVQYGEPGCTDCPAPQVVHATAQVAGANVNALLMCKVPPSSEDDLDCHSAKAIVDGTPASGWVQYRAEELCGKLDGTILASTPTCLPPDGHGPGGPPG